MNRKGAEDAEGRRGGEEEEKRGDDGSLGYLVTLFSGRFLYPPEGGVTIVFSPSFAEKRLLNFEIAYLANMRRHQPIRPRFLKLLNF